MPSKKKKYNARFPPARIKKIMQTDEDVGKVAAAVPVIISRALELFIDSLISKTGETTHSKNAKTLTPTHIKQTIHGEKKFDFLRDLVAGIPDHHAEDEVELPSTSSAKKPRKPRKKKDDPGKIRSRRNTESSGDNDNNEEDEEESTETDDESRSQMSESSSSNMASYPSMTNQMGYTPGPHAGNFPAFRMGQAMPRMGLPGTPTTPLDVAGSVLVPPYSPQMQSNLVQNFYHTQSFFQANPFMQQTAGPVNLCTKNDNSISSNGSSSMSVKTEGNLPMPSSSKQFDQAFPSSSTSISSQMTFNPNPKLNSEDDDYDT